MPRSYRFAEGASDCIFLAERRHAAALPSVPGIERLAAAEARKTEAKAKSAATRVLKRPSDASAAADPELVASLDLVASFIVVGFSPFV